MFLKQIRIKSFALIIIIIKSLKEIWAINKFVVITRTRMSMLRNLIKKEHLLHM